MPQVKPEMETFAKIKVVGIGGAGGAAVNRMVNAKIRGVDFVVMNTDVQALHHNFAATKLHLGKSITRGLGAGMDPEIGFKAAEESQNEIRDLLKETDMVFITCGLGGGTGSGAGPIVAEIAHDLGALTVAVVTKPFSFEGPQRRDIAEGAWERLARQVDTIITIPNDRVLQVIDKKTTLLETFRIVDEILRQGVQGISELITVPGLINVDFADVKTIMKNTGSAMMGIGSAKGDNRAVEAAQMAISSPLLELSIDGAHGILFTVTGSSNLAMSEINEAAKIVTSSAADDAKVIWGTVIDDSLDDEMRINVIATGFDSHRPATVIDSDSAPIGFLGGKYAPSNFLRRTQKDDEDQEKKFKQFTQKSAPPESTNFPTRAKRVDELLDTEEKKSNQDDLEIPAFIRKKMGI
ncbi:MAG: cell division protein FtsZ [Candidatus Magasanikbacteria bacterium RIFOXYD2_FULL_41_14]|uniref:Cell division protein FtsZ n=1 Tax=Candidatus Magasanikbacteria bacterium RIFOXYD2_FULL_41_14 TaxID=1798709 RepID=A0A1F6PCE8_9BACT|nr:MAG: cell division protein FtsZ [Candidatus Magasanikbacteria bacterium RIFOXYD2_FULL_41_14]